MHIQIRENEYGSSQCDGRIKPETGRYLYEYDEDINKKAEVTFE